MKRTSEKAGKHSFKLRTKLLVSFLMVALLGLLLVGGVSVHNIYRFSRREVERNSIANLTTAMEHTLDRMLELRVDLIRPRVEPGNTTAIVDLLTNGETSYENMFDLQFQLSSANAVVGIDSLFYMNEDHMITQTRGSEMSFSYMMEKEWFSDWYHGTSPYTWGPTYEFQGNYVIPYVRKIIAQGQTVGVSLLNMKESAIQELWEAHGNIILVDKHNYVLSAEHPDTLGKTFQDAYGVDLSKIPTESSFTVRYDGVNYHGIFYREHVYGMGMVELLPQSTTGFAVVSMLRSTIWILVLVAVLCAVLALLLSTQITKPLQNATEMVKNLKLDDEPADLPITTNDEIGILIESINDMTRRLEASKQDILEISDARRLAEYRAIQLQINPHFLYNTLATINWFAEQNQPENVKKVADSLSMLFRISVNHGREMLHIIEEIQHVRCYLDIQMLRHKDEFTYQIDVDPEILSYYTIKIILQPLVENSLYHGIRENGITNGFIRVVGRRKGDNIELLVIDNGNTPQAEIDRMNMVLQNPDSREDDGIGMLNVHNRIRYFYQNGYGLKYEKKDDLTIARVELPVVEEAKEDV